MTNLCLVTHLSAAPISIVVPNWNGRRWLPTCLDSLAAQSLPASEVIVVDDGSTDDSVVFVRQSYPGVRVVSLADNRGFCRAANVGIAAATQGAILLLNNDARLDPGCLQVLADALDVYPEASFFALHILDAAGTRLESLGAGATPEATFFPRGLGQPAELLALPGEGEAPIAVPVLGSSAGAGLYRRTLFDDIGVFDESLDMYLEDVDLDLRAQLRGHTCLALPQAVALHMGSTTLGAASPRVVTLLIRNRLLLVAKCWPTSILLASLGRLLLGQLRSALFYASQGQALLYVGAMLRALAKLPGTVGRRAALQAGRSISGTEFGRLLERP